MPVTTDTMRSMSRMNVFFALSATILLITVLWFVVVDHDLGWREYQDDYMVAQGVLAHFDYLYTQRASQQEKLRQAKETLNTAELVIKSRQPIIDEWRRKIDALAFDQADIKLKHGNLNSLHQVTLQKYEEVLAEHGPDHPETREIAERKEREAEQLAESTREKERVQDAITAAERQIKDLMTPLTEAQKTYNTLEQEAGDAAKKSDEYAGVFRRAFFNAPMLDFAAPKNTPGVQEIKQLILPDVVQNLNYLKTYTLDRCTTCHVAIDDKRFTLEALVEKLEQAIPSINEALAKRRRPSLTFPAPPRPDSPEAPVVKEGRVADRWDWLTKEQRQDYFDALVDTVNHYLRDEGWEELTINKALLAHPDLDLYVSVDSPHPMKKMGCTVCHEGNPLETDFVLAAHTPPDHETRDEWAENYYSNNLGVPAATFELIDHYWDRHMTPTQYTEGSCLKCHRQVSGVGSHGGEPQAKTVKEGYDLFTRVGCVNCHKVEGLDDYPKVGPNLAHVADKLDKGFTEQWIFNPRAFRPSTWMPHFFLQENNDAGSESQWDEEPRLRTEVEVAAMTHYLHAVSQPWEDREPIPDGLTGNPENGRTLFTKVGCLACHSNLAEFGEKWIVADRQAAGETPDQARANHDAMTYPEKVVHAMTHFPDDRDTLFRPETVEFDPNKDYNKPIFTRVAPELSGMGNKTTVEWLYAWLRNPQSYHAETRMPSLRLTEQEALDIATYLHGLKLDPKANGFSVEAFPDDERHRAMADERVRDILASQRSMARAEATMRDEGGELTRMVKLLLENSPARDVAHARIDAMDAYQKRLFFLGNKAVSHYGCYACHDIAGFETAVRPGTELTVWADKPLSQLDYGFFYEGYEDLRHEEKNRELFAHLYPPHRPDLVERHRGVNPEEQVAHTHAAFVFHKMLNPRIWDRAKKKKPLDKLKMPNFYFTPDQARAIATFVLGLKDPRVKESLVARHEDGDPRGAVAQGRELTHRYNCVGCHRIENNVATLHQYFRVREGGMERFDEVNAPPALRGQGAKVQADWFYGFLNDVEMLRPWLEVRMPSFHLSDREATSLVEHFAGLSKEESNDLHERLRAIHDYVESEKLSAAKTDGEKEEEAIPPGDDWFIVEAFEDRREFLVNYAIRNRLMRAFQLDPEENDEESLAGAYHQVLNETTFLRDLYDAKYPFGDVARPNVSEERFKLGEELMLDLGCLSCHVLGDPNVEGSNSNPSAPNLNLTYRRLRQDWVRSWLRAPAVIQPGTKMPQLWPGMKSAFADFGDVREEFEIKYGKTADEQIELLLDYLVAAGFRNHTAIDPSVKASAPPAEEMEEFDEFDDAPAEEEEEFFDD